MDQATSAATVGADVYLLYEHPLSSCCRMWITGSSLQFSTYVLFFFFFFQKYQQTILARMESILESEMALIPVTRGGILYWFTSLVPDRFA